MDNGSYGAMEGPFPDDGEHNLALAHVVWDNHERSDDIVDFIYENRTGLNVSINEDGIERLRIYLSNPVRTLAEGTL